MHFIVEPKVHINNALRLSGLCFTCVFCGSVACFKDRTCHSLKHFFQVTTILNLGQLNVQYKKRSVSSFSNFHLVTVPI